VIRTLIADDHPAFRAGLKLMLATSDEIEIVGEAEDGTQVVALAAELAPDVVVMDLRMPGLDGIEATRQLVTARPDLGVVVLTMFEDDESVFAAVRAGARGYILKGAGSDEILRALRCIAEGGVIFGPSIARRIDALLSPGPDDLPNLPFPQLTDREREVLDLIAAGLPNGQIRDKLGLAGKTVGNHISSIFAKLQVADRAQAIVRARDAGLGR